MALLDFYYQQAVKEVWANPHGDRHAMFRLVRLSKLYGALGSLRLPHTTIHLPVIANEAATNWVVYEMGAVPRSKIGIDVGLNYVWVSLKDILVDSKMTAMVFTRNRFINPEDIYLTQTPDKSLIIAIKYVNNSTLLNYGEPVFIRFYSNLITSGVGVGATYGLTSYTHNSGDYGAYLGFVNTFQAETSQCFLYKDGYLLPDGIPSFASLNTGDKLYYVNDPFVVSSQEILVSDMHTYTSVLDSVQKRIASSVEDSFYSYVDDIEFYLVGTVNGERKAVYFPRLSPAVVRQLTFKDWALNAVLIDAIKDDWESYLGATITDLTLKLFIRDNGEYKAPVVDSNRIHDLMNLDAERRNSAFRGLLANLEIWQAVNLENCPLNRFMGLESKYLNPSELYGVYSHHAAITEMERVWQDRDGVWHIPPMASNGGGRLMVFENDGTRKYIEPSGVDLIWAAVYTALAPSYANATISLDGYTVAANPETIPSGFMGVAAFTNTIVPADNNIVTFKLPDPTQFTTLNVYIGLSTAPNIPNPPDQTFMIYAIGGTSNTANSEYLVNGIGGIIGTLDAGDNTFAGTTPLEWSPSAVYGISFDADVGANGTMYLYSSLSPTPDVPVLSHAFTQPRVAPVGLLVNATFSDDAPTAEITILNNPGITFAGTTPVAGGYTLPALEVVYPYGSHSNEPYVGGKGYEQFLPNYNATEPLDVVAPAGDNSDTVVENGFGIFCYYYNGVALYPCELGTDYNLVEDGSTTKVVWLGGVTAYERYVRTSQRRVEWIREVSESEIVDGIDLYNGRAKTHDVGMGHLYVWYKGRYMIEGLDYHVKSGKIYLVSKFIWGTTPHIVEVLYCGLPNYSLHHEPRGSWGWVKHGKISYDNRYNLYSNRNKWIFVDGKAVPPNRFHNAENYEEINLSVGDIAPNDGVPFAIMPLVQFTREEDLLPVGPSASDDQIVDTRIENYLSTVYPQGTDNSPILIASKYDLYSPLLNKLIREIDADNLTIPFGTLSNAAVETIVTPYLDLLTVEPGYKNHDLDFVEIHPMRSINPVAVTIAEYNFLLKVNELFLNNSVSGFNLYLTITP